MKGDRPQDWKGVHHLGQVIPRPLLVLHKVLNARAFCRSDDDARWRIRADAAQKRDIPLCACVRSVAFLATQSQECGEVHAAWVEEAAQPVEVDCGQASAHALDTRSERAEERPGFGLMDIEAVGKLGSPDKSAVLQVGLSFTYVQVNCIGYIHWIE